MHDVFDYGYAEIAAIVGKSEDNVRQLATRTRRHVEQRRPRFQTTREQRDELARRFFQAAEQGELAGLEALLASDVELTGDGGGKAPALARSLHGRDRVARTLINWVRLAARLPGVSLRPVEVNGGPGALYLDAQQRESARVLYRSLMAAQERFDQGERKVRPLIEAGSQVFVQEPSVRLDYFEIVDPETLDPVDDLSLPALVAVAAFVGKARLIDNIVLRPA